MKISRHKNVRRCLNFYKNNFQFKTPYRVLIDATFCNEALRCKLNIREQVPKYLQDPNVQFFTTACVISEVEMLASEVYGAMLIAKSFKVRICGHEKKPVSASECLYSMIADGNPDHYMMATQDKEISKKCRLAPGVPLLYVAHNAVNLEKPSTLSKDKAEEKSKESVRGVSDQQIALMQKLIAKLPTDKVESKKTWKRKAQGPNPLSCKKKSKVSAPPPEKKNTRKRHKRNKNKVKTPSAAELEASFYKILSENQ